MSEVAESKLNTVEVQKFLESLLDPERFGYSVTEEVRDGARELLGIKKVRKA